MRLKKYFAPDVKEALQKIRHEIGEDVAIVSNRSVAGGVELVVALDYEENQAPNNIEKEETVEWTSDQNIYSVKKEISLLRKMVEHQLTGLAWHDYQRQNPIRALMLNRLLQLGFSREICQSILNELHQNLNEEASWDCIKNKLTSNIKIYDEISLRESKIISLIGASGSGKTTTLTKLATRFVTHYGSEQVGIISTDAFRIGRQEQLRSYATILNVSLKIVDSIQALHHALNKFAHKKIILLDHPSFSQRDTQFVDHMDLLRSMENNISHLLLIPANIQKSVCNQLIDLYSQVNLTGCVITKLDESCFLGEVLSSIMLKKLPIIYLTNGQRVPEDLMLAHSNDLAEIALKETSLTDKTLDEDELAYALNHEEINAN